MRLPYGLVNKVDFSRGLSGRLFGGGTVVMRLVTGEVIGVADIEKPQEVAAKIHKYLGGDPTRAEKRRA